MHPHLKEARDGHAAKLKRIAGFHGTSNLPSGDNPPPVNQANGPQPAAGQLKADGKLPRKNLGKFARGGKAKHKGTNVNIMIGHPGGPPAAMPMAAAPALPMPRPAVPPMPPPGMAPPGAMPPGVPPGLPPGVIPPHKRGGHVFKRGGKVKRADGGSAPLTPDSPHFNPDSPNGRFSSPSPRAKKHGGNVAPQYPQTVKTAVKQPSLKADMKAKGGRAKGKWAGGPMPVQAPVSPPAGAMGQGLGRPMPQGPVQWGGMQRPSMPMSSLRLPGGIAAANAGAGSPAAPPPAGFGASSTPTGAAASAGSPLGAALAQGMQQGIFRRGGKTKHTLKRKTGGRTYEAGAASGEGRLEKIEHYGKKAHMKPHRGD